MALKDIYNIIGNSSDYYQLYKTQRFDVSAYKGDTFELVFNVTDNAQGYFDSGYDVTGFDILSQMKINPTDDRPLITFDASFDTTSIPGQTLIRLIKDASTMDSISAGLYWFDIQILNAQGIKETWVKGRIKVEQDVSNYDQYRFVPLKYKFTMDVYSECSIVYPVSLYKTISLNDYSSLSIVNSVLKSYNILLNDFSSLLLTPSITYSQNIILSDYSKITIN